MIYALVYSFIVWNSSAQQAMPAVAPATPSAPAVIQPAPPAPDAVKTPAKPKKKRKKAKAVAPPPPPPPPEEPAPTSTPLLGIPIPGVEPETDFDDKATPDQTKRPDSKDGPFFGVTFGAGWTQDYPGSKDGRMRYLAIPAYKSKYFTIDRQDGVKGDLVERETFQFSVSFMFLFPTDSEKIPARFGMPDLGWTLQLGPEFRIELFHNNFHTMYLRLPLRFVANTDFHHRFDYLDYNFAPGFRNIFDFGKYGEVTTRIEADIAAEKYSDLFYQVDPQFSTASRPAFDAKAGLMQYIAGINYSYYDFFPWTVFAGANVYLASDSKNKKSPLFFKETNFSVLTGFVRYF